MDTEFDTRIKVALYNHFAKTGTRPGPEDVAAHVDSDSGAVLDAYRRLAEQRVLFLEKDGSSIRMAPPFSGVETQHVVESGGIRYYANCAWDALGIPAALHQPGAVQSRCGQSGDLLQLKVSLEGPPPSDWLFHCLVPAAKWWDDIVFT